MRFRRLEKKWIKIFRTFSLEKKNLITFWNAFSSSLKLNQSKKKMFVKKCKKIVLGGLHPPNPQFLTPPMHRGLWPRALDAFRLNLSSQLVLGYYWLAFLNWVHVSIFFVNRIFFLQEWPNFQESCAMLWVSCSWVFLCNF